MEIKNIPIGQLIPYKNNPRRNDSAVGPVAKSIQEFGFKVPIVIDKSNEIVAGHTRYKAAKKLKLKEVPCIIADDLSEDQIKAFRLADNRVGELAEWDEDLLAGELDQILMDMDDFGFADFEIDPDAGEPQEDFYQPEPPKQPKAKPGDIYLLGEHRLMCGSATDEDNVKALMGDRQADLVVTDPPYNVDYTGKTKDALKEGGAFYIWHADSEGYNFRSALAEAGGTVRQCLIWNKNTMVLGRQDYQWKHEPCLYGWKDGAGHYFTDDRTNTTVWEDNPDIDKMNKEQMKELLHTIFDGGLATTVIDEAKPAASREHPTMKPVRLIARQIKNSSRRGQIVLDLFGGSGTTLIAAEQLHRRCYMMELDPVFIDVIIDRREKFTGKEAIKLNDDE